MTPFERQCFSKISFMVDHQEHPSSNTIMITVKHDLTKVVALYVWIAKFSNVITLP